MSASENEPGYVLRYWVSGSGPVLRLGGELDLGTVAVLTRAGLEFHEGCRARRDGQAAPGPGAESGSTAVLDVSELAFIDAGGIGALVGIRNRLAEAGITLDTPHPSPAFRRISAICQLNDLLGIHPADPNLSGAGRRDGTDPRQDPNAASAAAHGDPRTGHPGPGKWGRLRRWARSGSATRGGGAT